MNYAKINNINGLVETTITSDTLPVTTGYTYIGIDTIIIDGMGIGIGDSYFDGSFSLMPLDAFGRVIQFMTDGTTDTYTINDQYQDNAPTTTVPNGTLLSVAFAAIDSIQVPTLNTVQQYTIGSMVADGLTYLQDQYDIQSQLLLVLMYQNSINQSLNSLQSYLQPFVTFLMTINVYKGNFVNIINNTTNINDCLAVNWNFPTIPYPAISLIEASAIAAG
jgi:hypothetical protein